MTTYWTSTSTYPEAANGMVKGARDLYGRDSTTCKQVVAAWKAVKVTPAAYLRHRGGVLHRATQHQPTRASSPAYTGVDRRAPRGSSRRHVRDGSRTPGHWFAWLGGYANNHTDRLSHANVRIPATKTARLKLYLLRRTPTTRA